MTDKAARKQAYDRDGFVVTPSIISDSTLATVREHVDAVLDGTLKPDRPIQCGEPGEFYVQWEPRVRGRADVPRREQIRIVFHMCHSHSFFWDLATSSAILDEVENLIGPNIRLYTDQMFVKPARHGSEVPWHQDSAYWPCAEPRLLSCWLALDDVTIENGCVRHIPGSHRREFRHEDIQTTNPNKRTVCAGEINPADEVPVEMKAGSACFHHSLTVHRSMPNESEHSRRGLVIIFLPSDLKFLKPWDFEYGFPEVRAAAQPLA